jgi:uncharacterized protein GlcG (DUF336 family)
MNIPGRAATQSNARSPAVLRGLAHLSLLMVISTLSPSAQAQVLMQPNVSLAQAMKIVNAVIAKCNRPGDLVTVTIAVVDRAGLPVMQVRGDTASPFSWELAYRKAYTALSVRRTSLEWRDMTAGSSELSGQRMLSNLIPLGGGAPIMMGDQAIGGVGVSGARGGQPADSACAQMGAATIADELK